MDLPSSNNELHQQIINLRRIATCSATFKDCIKTWGLGVQDLSWLLEPVDRAGSQDLVPTLGGIWTGLQTPSSTETGGLGVQDLSWLGEISLT